MALNRGESTRAVVKFGGEVVARVPQLMAVLQDVATLTGAGWKILICHGGGPQASAAAQRLGVSTVKVGGRRVTDAATLEITKFVLAGQVSVDICAAAAGVRIPAVGVSGVSAGVVTARRRPPRVVSGGGPEPVDFGWVGDVEQIRVELLEHLWRGGFVPVLNSLGVGAPTGEPRPCDVFNINADTVAAATAAALNVQHLFMMTDVPGILRDREDPSSRIPRLDVAAARVAIADGTIAGGMIPKVEDAIGHLARGIGAVHILGAEPGALEAAAAEPGARGTVLCP